jgi:hypothetical protein
MLYHVGIDELADSSRLLVTLVDITRIFSIVHEQLLRHIFVAAFAAFVPLHTGTWDGA